MPRSSALRLLGEGEEVPDVPVLELLHCRFCLELRRSARPRPRTAACGPACTLRPGRPARPAGRCPTRSRCRRRRAPKTTAAATTVAATGRVAPAGGGACSWWFLSWCFSGGGGWSAAAATVRRTPGPARWIHRDRKSSVAVPGRRVPPWRCRTEVGGSRCIPGRVRASVGHEGPAEPAPRRGGDDRCPSRSRWSSSSAAARAGDAAAWDALVDRYLPLVTAVIGRLRLSPADADDVNQTVWLRLVEHLDGLREPRALPGWLATTARNEGLRLIRAPGPRPARRPGWHDLRRRPRTPTRARRWSRTCGRRPCARR